MREIFSAYVERGLSVRQIAFELRDRAIPSPTGKPQWGTSAIDRVLHNEAYIGTVYYNRHERIEGAVRGRKTRLRERPREEWIPIPVPAIIDRDTFDRVTHITHDNFKLSPRGAAPETWLLRGLIQCGHCHVSCSCHRSYGRNGKLTRYYTCRNHDVLRAGSEERLCPEHYIRANELDQYVFDQVRQALLDPQQLIAGERAALASAPDENELIARQLNRLDAALDAKHASAPAYSTPTKLVCSTSKSSPDAPARSPPGKTSSREKERPSLPAAPSLPPRTACVAGSPGSANVSPRHSTTSTSKAAGAYCDSSSKTSASAAGGSKSISRSPSRTNHRPTPIRPTTDHRDLTNQSPVPRAPRHRQPMCAYVPFIEMAHEGVPLVVIQRRLGHANLGITSV